MRLLLLAIALLGFTASAYADQYVNGYTRQNGTYVAPHYRSSPDSSISNNWSTQGNTNPYTGAVGTRNPYNSGSHNTFGGSTQSGFGQPSSNTWGSSLSDDN